MKNYFVDFEGWVKVEAENEEDAKRIANSLFWRMHLREDILNYHVDIDEVEEEE